MTESTFQVPTVQSCVSKHDHEKYKEDNVESSVLPPFNLKPTEETGGKFYYGVRVVTGEQEGAGTADTGVFVTLVGSKGQSGKIYLMSWLTALSGTAKRRTYDDLLVESDGDLGEILVVILGNDKSWIEVLGAPWFVDFVSVSNLQTNSGHQEFPCYHWIGDGCSVTFTANTTTPNKVSSNDILMQQRREQLELRKSMYGWSRWEAIPGMPSIVDDSSGVLPDDEKLSRLKRVHFTNEGKKAGYTLKLEGFFITVDNISDYEELADTMHIPDKALYQAARWTSDVEVGQQMLNGVNPMILERCTTLPPNFPVTNEMVKNILCRGLSLEEEMKAGRIYIFDTKMMDGLPAREDAYFTAPIGLFYVNPSGQLVPIAIQCRQGLREEEKGIPNPIFFPTDGWIDWILAKLYLQSANMQLHQIVTHYLSCHAVMEAYGVATLRNLPDPHPIYKVLAPHFRYSVAMNFKSRQTLMNTGGIVDQKFGIGGPGKVELFGRGYSAYSVNWTNIKHSIKRRGVDDPALLPGFYWRDDGVKLWDATEQYVRDVVNEFYATDNDVKEDTEIQGWAADMHTNGFPAHGDSPTGHGFPKEILSKELLIERVTTIIFTGSVQHTSVNFGQFFYLGFAPNAPCALMRAPPTEKGKATYKTLLETLPDKATAIAQSAVTYALSQYSDDEIFFGDFPSERFTEKNIKEAIQRFQKRLSDISAEIHKRNETLDMPYIYMIPEKISNSITT